MSNYVFRLAGSTELKAPEVELRILPRLFLNFVVEGLALEGAIELLGDEHLLGTRILFSDLQERLAERNQAARKLLSGYNLFGPEVGFEPTSLPSNNCMAPNLAEWKTEPMETDPGFSAVFSQTEYFNNLDRLIRLSSEKKAPIGKVSSDVERELFNEFKNILETRPMILVGYGLIEEDVDVVFALHSYRRQLGAYLRWRLAEKRERSPSREERLRQMGIAW